MAESVVCWLQWLMDVLWTPCSDSCLCDSPVLVFSEEKSMRSCLFLKEHASMMKEIIKKPILMVSGWCDTCLYVCNYCFSQDYYWDCYMCLMETLGRVLKSPECLMHNTFSSYNHSQWLGLWIFTTQLHAYCTFESAIVHQNIK